MSPRIPTPNKFPKEADAAGPETTLWEAPLGDLSH